MWMKTNVKMHEITGPSKPENQVKFWEILPYSEKIAKFGETYREVVMDNSYF